MVDKARARTRQFLRSVVPLGVRRAPLLRTPGREARRLLAESGKAGLRLVAGDDVVPPGRVFFLRRLLRWRDALLPDNRTLAADARNLANPFLKHALAGSQLGTWALSIAAIDFLQRQVCAHAPTCVLEFGSGASTICLARFMQELRGTDGEDVHVFSVEQDVRFADETLSRLKALGLDRHVRMLVAPLSRQVIEGRGTTCYTLPARRLADFLGGARPGLVVIDGPAADEGRFGTLPLVRSFVQTGTWFYLDDALRDDELADAAFWQGLPYMRLNGFWLRDKGMLIGQVMGA